tara:strand:- start:386 stop:613 length:228 start_codon:yes stop_codon:yes gene_type:complete
MSNQYFRDQMTLHSPEPRHKLRWEHGLVSLQQRASNSFAVRYGKQVDAGLDYAEACSKLGQALLHQLSCNGQLHP